MCWQSCQTGYTDTGIACLKPLPYGRGAGYAIWDQGRCERHNDDVGGCEKYGAIWYPKCREGYHNNGCCICSVDCSDGMTDIGVSCQKQSYGRGVGIPLGCASDEEIRGSHCFKKCAEGFELKGEICWAKCPSNKFSCDATCAENAEVCSTLLRGVPSIATVTNTYTQVSFAKNYDMLTILRIAGATAEELAWGICNESSAQYVQ